MITYLIVDLVVLAIILVGLRKHLVWPNRAWWMTLIGLLVLTAVFDSLLVSFDIVGYAPERILGLYIGTAPIEDFFYPLVAAILLPTVWRLLEKKHA